jgi:hypothetical protein
MHKKTMLIAVVALAVSSINLFAVIPAALRGNYRLIAGYTSGYYTGLFGYGTATVSSSGAISYSCYYPYVRATGRGNGTLNSTGLFSLNNGVSGKAQIYSNRVGSGAFSDSNGRGYFGVAR